MSFLSQCQQALHRFRNLSSPVTVDTITTRFLLLFIILLAIPLITVIIFTVSLLAAHVDESATLQLVLSRNLFESALSESRNELALLESVQADSATVSHNYRQACHPGTDDFCALINHTLGRVQLGENETQPLASFLRHMPDLREALLKKPNPPQFFARQGEALFLLGKSTDNLPPHTEAFYGVPINARFLNRIYKQQPSLQTAILVYVEPSTPDQRFAAIRSAQDHLDIPSEEIRAVTRALSLQTQQAVTLELDHHPFRILQDALYAPDNRQIARVLHILPLSQTQMLLNNYYLGIYIISVASLIFTVLLAMMAGRTITQPLLKLIAQVNTLSRGNVMKDKDEVAIMGVHEIRQLGEAFNRMINRLRQEHKLKDEFVATLTHDLKVPLLAEKQTLSYFLRHTYGGLTPEQTEVLDILRSSNQSCLSLVNGLLEVYRYDSGAVHLMLEPFDFALLMAETMGELQSLAQEKSITLGLANDLAGQSGQDDGPESAVAIVYADRLEIKRVLHNLISNAIINTPLHGIISCRITNAKCLGTEMLYKISSFQYTTLSGPIKLTDRLLVQIQDSGIGFSHEDLPYLFKQFAASRGRNPMSMGLGLYNSCQVVAEHHCLLWVESTEGVGASVNFVLPVNRQVAEDRRIFRDRRQF